MAEAPAFDFHEVFDEDYLFFYADRLSDEQSDQETALIQELLALPPGSEVLDLACGHGRIANRLASAGFGLTGLDASELFLEAARKDASARGVDVEYVPGDMRTLPWSNHFDAVVNWFTAWGYFSDDENLAVLREVARALKPGGMLLLETLNRDWLVKNFQKSNVLERDGAFCIDQRTWDHATGFILTERLIFRGGKARRFTFSVRTFTLPEMAAWLRDAGFSGMEAFAGPGEPYSPDVPRLIIRATK